MKAQFTSKDIQDFLQMKKKRLEAAILEALKFVGEEFITICRENGTYTDQTGNLRSSIGYMIFQNGQVVFESFPGSNAPAVEIARRVALDAAQRLGGNGFLFVGVAGMEYAASVEARGFDVISMGSIRAADALRRAMERIKRKANRR